MAHNIFIHVTNYLDCLIILQPDVFENNFVNKFGSAYTISNSVSMFVANKDLTSVHLIWLNLSVNHSESFWDLAFVTHLLKVLN